MNLLQKVGKLFTPVYKKSLSSILGLSRNGELNWNSNECFKSYEINSYVFSCVNKRAEKVAGVEFYLEKNDEEIENEDIINLLYKPNLYQTKDEFIKEWQTFKDLTGEAFIRKEKIGKKVIGLHNLSPKDVSDRQFDEFGKIISIQYNNPYTGKSGKILAEDLIISFSKSLLSPKKALSPVMAGAIIIDTARQLGIYQNKVLENGGKVEGILSFNDELDDSQKKSIKDEFDKKFAGSENAGKPMVFDGGATYQNLGLTPTELSYIESIKLTRNDILMIFGVPKAIVAQTDDVNYANAKTAKDIFLSETIKPLLKSFVSMLNEDTDIVPEDIELMFIDPTPEDVELKLKQIDNGKNNGYLTINEMRKLAGYDERPDGDVIMIPFGMQTFDEALSPILEMKMKSFSHPLKNKTIREAYYKMYKTKMDKYNAKMLKLIKNIFKEQRDYVVSKLRIDQKSFTMKKSIIDEIFNVGLQIEIVKDSLLPLLEEITRGAGQDAFRIFNIERTFRIKPDYANQINKRAENLGNWINKTTQEQLQGIFSNSIEANETISQLADRIENEFGDISKGRARTIANTETATAWNTGRYEAYSEMQVPIKIWVHTSASMHPRDEHIAMDGEEAQFNQPFSNGLMYPNDPAGSPEETINCGCTW